MTIYCLSIEQLGGHRSPVRVKSKANNNSIHQASIELSHNKAVPLKSSKCTAIANDNNIHSGNLPEFNPE